MSRATRHLFAAVLLATLLLTLVGCDQDRPTPTPTSPPAPTVAPPKLPSNTPRPALATATPPPTPVSVPKGGTLTVRLLADLNNFNPLLNVADASAGLVNSALFNGLTRLDGSLQPQPDLAESWQVSPDGLRLSFRLRQGVLWHDGQPLTAADVIYTYEAWSRLPQTTRLQAHLTAARVRVTTPDPAGLTVVFEMGQPYAPLLADLSTPILPAHRLRDVPLEKLGSDPFAFQPVGTGPFKFASHEVGQNIILTANPAYHLGAPNLERLAFVVAPDERIAAQAVRDGNLLYASLNHEQAVSLQATAGITASLAFGSYPEDGYYFLAFNLRPGHLFSDYRLRRALAYSLDRDAIVRQATAGQGLPLWSFALPNTWAYEPTTPRYGQNIGEAKRLLAEAGWQPGAGGGLQQGGKLLAFKLYLRADDPTRRQAANLIAAQAATLGISVTVAAVDPNSVLSALLDPTRDPAFDFEAILAGWGTLGYDFDPYPLLASDQQPTAAAPGLLNYVGYNNADFTARAAAARREYDFAARKAQAADLQNTLAAELPYDPLWAAQYFTVASRKLAASDGTPLSLNSPNPLWNVERWFISK